MRLFQSRRWNDAPEPEHTSMIDSTIEKLNPTPRMQALWEQVQKRKKTGLSHSVIARELGVNRQTVRKYWDADRSPVYGPKRPQATKLTRYLPYLYRRWGEGCHNARQLYRELVQQGYDGPSKKSELP